MRFEGFGWCIGKLVARNKDRRFKINGNLVNFMAKFDIDEGTAQLSLKLTDYDTSPDGRGVRLLADAGAAGGGVVELEAACLSHELTSSRRMGRLCNGLLWSEG